MVSGKRKIPKTLYTNRDEFSPPLDQVGVLAMLFGCDPAVLVRPSEKASESPRARSRPSARVRVATSAESSDRRFCWPEISSRSTNCTIMKIDSTNIRISRSAVIMSTKPGQTAPESRPLRRAASAISPSPASARR